MEFPGKLLGPASKNFPNFVKMEMFASRKRQIWRSLVAIKKPGVGWKLKKARKTGLWRLSKYFGTNGA